MAPPAIPKPFERDQLLLCITEAGAGAERQFADQLPQGSSEGAIVRQMRFYARTIQISLGEIKMILAQTVMDWRPVLAT